MKKYFILLLILVLSLVAASQASAGTAKMGERYRLESGETVSENLYVGSGDINLAGNVLGDFIAGGGNVTVTGSVAKDTMLAGGSLNILGMTGEDLRVAGGNIIIGESVGGDLVAVGGSVQVLSGVTVGGEALVAGGSVVIDGTIQKDLVVSGGDVQINGRVMGNVRAKRVDRLTLGSNAVIEGNLDYGSRREAVISEGARVGGAVNFDQITKPARYGRGAEKGFIAALLGLFTLIALTKFAIIATAALLLVYFFRDGLLQVTEEISRNFGREVLRGFIVMVTVPAGAMVLALTIAGLIPAAFAMLGYAGLILAASIYSGVFFGSWLHKKYYKREMMEINWKIALGGIIVLALAGALPLVGWIVDLAVMLAALGGLSNALYRRLWLM
jgi:hypothetical protein